MFENFRQWYRRYYTEITWFLIGWLVMSGLVSLHNNDLEGAIISFALAAVNYFLSKRP